MCADETVLSTEQFPVRSMWPTNAGFTIQYHDYTYTILHVREPGAGPGALLYSGPSIALPGDLAAAAAAGDAHAGEACAASHLSGGDRSCDDPQGQGEDTILTSNPNQEPEVLTHSGYYWYLEACMFTDPHCVDHVLHLCDMWESQLSSKPIYTGYTKHSLDYERDLLRVTQLYGAAAPRDDPPARPEVRGGLPLTMRDSDRRFRTGQPPPSTTSTPPRGLSWRSLSTPTKTASCPGSWT